MSSTDGEQPINEPGDDLAATTHADPPETGDDLAATTHADPLAGDFGDEWPAGEPLAERRGAGRLVLGILAALAAAAVVVAGWSYVYVAAGREYLVFAVILGLAVGLVLRTVSGRSSIPVRVLAGVLTVAGCAAGTLSGDAAFNADLYRTGYWEMLTDAILPDWQSRFGARQPVAWAIFAAAAVLAFLVAAPAKPSKKDAAARDDESDDALAGTADEPPPPYVSGD